MKIRDYALFGGVEIGGYASFARAEIGDYALFGGAKIGGNASFGGATIGAYAAFEGAEIGGYAGFGGVKIGGYAGFEGVKIGGNASFEGATIAGYAAFGGAEIGGNAFFDSMTVDGSARFDRMRIKGANLLQSAQIKTDASFKEAEISKRISLVGTSIGQSACFDQAKIGCAASSDEEPSSFDVASVAGPLTFNDTHFAHFKDEEAAYRAAKRNCNDRGATADADDCFYREMVARRKQKKQPIKSMELAVQFGLGYGARPSWLLGWWVFIAFVGAIALALASSNWQKVGDGFAAAFVPGYLIMNGQSGTAELVAAILTVLNFFLWAAFIAVFSRKYID